LILTAPAILIAGAALLERLKSGIYPVEQVALKAYALFAPQKIQLALKHLVATVLPHFRMRQPHLCRGVLCLVPG
jgi:hypothetical protein